MISGKRYPAHRLAWKIMTGRDPGEVVDHIDGDRKNNKFSNLRDANLVGNSHNSALSSRNTSGVKGVSFHKRSGLYQCQIMANGKYTSVGYFKDAQAAEKAANAARLTLHGEFACAGYRGAS
ncbi:HNH endonuclease [Pseudohoeflea suaedae]|uniref:HNH endonuclease n=1 Tax=Pseudohoeflea suaedae TaxID=877384 RepID=A0A4R5PJ64_9HYPH|nr:HNH endonuclease [Pseudohoeflea suaedae]